MHAADIQVVVDDVQVRYHAPASGDLEIRPTSRVQRAVNTALGRKPSVVVRALAGVSLVAHAGEAVGIVGLNGSGKSTLLRIIAGLEAPSRGRVYAREQPVLLGVNAALLPDLTGRQNVHLGCLAMGMTPEQADAVYQDIVDLSGLGKFIHLPMTTYSSGMAARLKFAIAAAANPQILLIDEALATGDASFRERSEQRMQALRERAGCVFLVSHAAQTVEETCTRAIWLHDGRVVQDGPAVDVARKYRWWAWNLAKGNDQTATALLHEATLDGFDTRITVSPADPITEGTAR